MNSLKKFQTFLAKMDFSFFRQRRFRHMAATRVPQEKVWNGRKEKAPFRHEKAYLSFIEIYFNEFRYQLYYFGGNNMLLSTFYLRHTL